MDQMQCRFMLSHGGTTVMIFILSFFMLLTSNQPFYIAFINIEKDSRWVVCMLINPRVAGVTVLMRLMHCIIKDMKRWAIVGNWSSEKF